jgi:hypothetical protein
MLASFVAYEQNIGSPMAVDDLKKSPALRDGVVSETTVAIFLPTEALQQSDFSRVHFRPIVLILVAASGPTVPHLAGY